jgi:NAD(P)H dehydrogenase (quinone)
VKILVVLGHPAPGSFNHALATMAVSTLEGLGHEVVFHDLYAEGFDPRLRAGEIEVDGEVDPEIRQHCRELAAADGIVIVHPCWWSQPPAILKGWVDRVFREDVAYRFPEGDDGSGALEGMLKARVAVVLNTSNTEPERELAVFGDPLEALWKSCILNPCGVEDVRRRNFGVVVTSSEEQRARWLDEAADMIRAAFPEREVTLPTPNRP